MSHAPVNSWTAPGLPRPLPYAALAGVRTRRMVAIFVDLIFISLLAFALWAVLGLLSFGLLWFVLPPLFPIVAFLYNGVTVSGWRMATPGMRMLDLEVRQMDGAPARFVNAAAHALLYYVSWMFPVVFIVTLLSDDKRFLHDMLSNLIVLRRSN
jgi:uncharacterized RDD family membrane protein YckC